MGRQCKHKLMDIHSNNKNDDFALLYCKQFLHIFSEDLLIIIQLTRNQYFFLFDKSSQNTGLTYLRIAHVIHSGCILVSLDLFYRYLFSNITGIIIEVLVCFQIKNFFYFFFFPSLFLLNPCFVF